MKKTKEQWIEEFRSVADSQIKRFSSSSIDKKEKTKLLNICIGQYRENALYEVAFIAKENSWSQLEILNENLLLTYASYIAMLEYRNKIWKYDYMAFARRIGELWEPFCKLAFNTPLKGLKIFSPQSFEVIQNNIKNEAIKYIDNLKLPEIIKENLKSQYLIPWQMVDSGGINLSLDLHFEQNNTHYNCDFKSGFSSNEKGNTNRLLLVGSIYNSIGLQEKNILFVRQKEDDNNHYLILLKKSPYWKVYCAEECYEVIKRFTGFDLKSWMSLNMNWQDDISKEFKDHLVNNNLLKYLTW